MPDKIINTNNSGISLFLTGVFASALVATPYVLDFTLTARLICFSVFALISFLLILKELKRFNTDIILLSYLGFTVFSIISFTWAINKQEALAEISRNILSFTAFSLSVFFIRRNRSMFLKLFFRIAVVICFIGAIITALQLRQLYDFSKESLYAVTGMNGHKNLYSSFLFLNLFFVLLSCFFSKGVWRFASIIASLLSLMLIGLLQTKAVWLGLAGAVITFFICTAYSRVKQVPKIKTAWVILSGVVLLNIIFLFVLKPIIHQGIDYAATASETVKLEQERLVLWDKTLDLFEKHKLIGVGAGNWQIVFPDETLSGLWRAEDLNYTFQRPHNDFLWILSETGIIGFNLFLLFIVSILVFAFKLLKVLSDKEDLRTLALAISFLVGFLIISFFDFPRERTEHLVWFAVILAIMYAYVHEHLQLKTYLTVKKNVVNLICPVLIVLVITTGIFRHLGEYYTRKIYNARNSGNHQEVIAGTILAQNFAYSVDPTTIPLTWYSGNAYAVSNNPGLALNEFLKAYKLTPFNRNVLNDLGSAYAVTGNRDLAKKYYEESMRISPRFDDAKLNIAALYIQEQNYKKASEYLGTLLHDSERRTKYQKLVDAFLQK